MSAGAQIALWGAFAFAPVLIAYRYHRLAALGLSTMLMLGWCSARVSAALLGPMEALHLYPMLDALFGALAFLCWRQRREWWKMALVCMFVVQCALHAAFWLAYPQDGLPPEVAGPILYRYTVANNVLFACELLCVSWAGGVDEWGRRVRAALSGRPSPFRHAGSAK